MTETIYRTNKIAYYRKKLGLTQTELRDRIFQSTGKQYRQATISAWEKGNSAPSVKMIQELAKILHVQVDDLYEKSTLADDSDIVYHQDLKAFEQVLEDAEKLFDKDPKKAFHSVKEQYLELVDKVGQLSDSNARLKATINGISEMIKA